MYSPSAVDHFYTTNGDERNNAVQNLGYNDEGITGYIYPSASYGRVPFYRLYNPTAHDHFYTANANEKNSAAQTGGYVDEGIAGYVLPMEVLPRKWRLPSTGSFNGSEGVTDFSSIFELLELYSSSITHKVGLAQTCILALISLGVVSATENTCPTDMAIPLHREFNKEHSYHFYATKATVASGWKLEGNAARICDFQAPDTVPFYRMYSPTAVDHFYTTDETQRSNAINNLGFNDEGIAGYIYSSTSQLCVTGSGQLQGPLQLFLLPSSNFALLISREMALILFETTLC
ncbi:uncharacterized protein ARMOST_19534 [Armillaria ostoyae]|uniref:DUF5648 domain-containing protein n=1 Tax=Armillaria ostoyae TaxID=47428 RepID=A0A284S4U1_ARMOS|nr:uncharacterized protein ARMOST_19534 [Armillaria ostoyae]